MGTASVRPTCKSAAEALAAGPLAGLLDQARLLGQVSTAIAGISPEAAGSEKALPPLRLAFEGRTVIITVATPSQAAKLRQRAAALSQLLQERVPEVTGIRIRLQPSRVADAAPTATLPNSASLPSQRLEPPPNLAAAIRFADDLTRELHDSPLRRSAQRLRACLRAKMAADE